MRIVYFIHSYPPALGGLEYLSSEIVKALKDAGHQVDVITGQGSTLDSYKTFSNWVNFSTDPHFVHRLPLNLDLQRWANRLLNKLIFISGTFSPWFFGPILKYDDKTLDIIKNADLLIGAGLPTKMIHDAYQFAKRFNKKLIIIPAYHHVSYYRRSIPFQQSLSYAHTIVCSTPKEKQDLITSYQIEPNKVKVITYSPYTDQDWRDAQNQATQRLQKLKLKLINHQPITFGYVGQITLRKNLIWFSNFFADNLSEFKLNGVSINLLLAGAKTNSSAQVEALLKPYINQIKIIYDFPKSRAASIYNQIDIFINPSAEESLGIVNFEALYHGCIVLVNNKSAFSFLFPRNIDTNQSYNERLNWILTNLSKYGLTITDSQFDDYTYNAFKKKWIQLLSI